MAELLLTDKRIDPSINGQSLIAPYLERDAWCNISFVYALMSDERVAVSFLRVSEASLSSYASLFSLRKQFRTDLSQHTRLGPRYQSFTKNIEEIEEKRRALLVHHLIPDLVDICLEYAPDLACHIAPKDIRSHFNLGYRGYTMSKQLPSFSFEDLSTL
jgi:hypothetical protein